jgi:hypothetical protein
MPGTMIELPRCVVTKLCYTLRFMYKISCLRHIKHVMQDLEDELSSGASASTVSVSHGAASFLDKRPEKVDDVGKSFGAVCVKLAKEDKKPVLVKTVNSVCITVVLLVVKGKVDIAHKCVSSFVSFLVAQQRCDVMVVKILEIFFTVFTTFITPSHGTMFFG